MSTLFQDSAGTTPAVLESPVGLQLDLRNTAYSTAFNGTSNTLTLDGSSGFVFGAGDFTVEGWFNFQNVNTTQALIDFRIANGAFPSVFLEVNGNITYYTNSTSVITTPHGMSAGNWYHIALSKVLGNTRIFVNGVQKGSTYADSNTYSVAPARPAIGVSGIGSTSYLNGFISNLRIVKGTGLYASNFTPPTAPLAAISGTSLLTCGTVWSGNPPITSNASSSNLNPFVTGTGNHRSQATSANRPLLSARYNLLLGTAALATQSITTVSTSYTITFAGAGTVTLSGTFIGVFTAGTNTFTATAGTLIVTVAGSVLTADIRPTNQTTTLPAYQAVVNSTTYDTAGFPQYLKYNGSNQFLSTASVDFTATAQMSVFAGVRKLSDVAAGVIVEMSSIVTTNNGSFLIDAPDVPVNKDVGVYLRGTSTVAKPITSAIVAAPATYTLNPSFAIATSGTTISNNLNGLFNNSSSASSGTGNFGNYPLYFGMRAGTSLPFNGQEYQMIIVGKTLTATQITSTETFVNNRTKAY